MKDSSKERLARIWRFLSPFLIVPGFRRWIEDFRRQSNIVYRGDALHRYILYCLAVLVFLVPFLTYWSETGVDYLNPVYDFGYPPVDAILRIFLILPPVMLYASFRDQILFWLDQRYGHVARIRRKILNGKIGIDDGGTSRAADPADDPADNPAGV